jgi:hypothetical protein
MTADILTSLPVLVCQTCGTQQEVPSLPNAPQRDVWLHCIKYGCGSTKFSLRMRVPIVKSEPAP